MDPRKPRKVKQKKTNDIDKISNYFDAVLPKTDDAVSIEPTPSTSNSTKNNVVNNIAKKKKKKTKNPNSEPPVPPPQQQKQPKQNKQAQPSTSSGSPSKTVDMSVQPPTPPLQWRREQEINQLLSQKLPSKAFNKAKKSQQQPTTSKTAPKANNHQSVPQSGIQFYQEPMFPIPYYNLLNQIPSQPFHIPQSHISNYYNDCFPPIQFDPTTYFDNSPYLSGPSTSQQQPYYPQQASVAKDRKANKTNKKNKDAKVPANSADVPSQFKVLTKNNNASQRNERTSNTSDRMYSRFVGPGLLDRYKVKPARLPDCWNPTHSRWFSKFERFFLDKNRKVEEVLFDFRQEDFDTLYTLLKKYFEYLQSSIENDSLQTFYFEYQEHVFDFVSTGKKFRSLLDLPNFLPEAVKKSFKETLHAYKSKLPANIKEARKNMMIIRANILKDTNRKDYQSFTFREKNDTNSPFWWRKDYALVVDSIDTVLEPQVFSYTVKRASDIEKKVKACLTIEEKLECAITEVGLSPQSYDNLKSIVDCLQKIIARSELKQFKPELYMFGSIASGLGTYDSDIDLYIKFSAVDDIVSEDFFTAILLLNNLLLILCRDLGVAEFGDCLVFSQRCPILKLPFNKCFPNLQRRFKDIKDFDRRLNRYKPRNNKRNNNKPQPKNQHQSQHSREDKDDVCSVNSDASDNIDTTPVNSDAEATTTDNGEKMDNDDIAKKVIGTSFNTCDISLKNMFGVYNSKFIRFLTEYDRRFYEIALLIKYWAKEHNIIGRTKITSYGMTMLVIFFLQNQQPPVLPPIQVFLDLATAQGKEEIVLQGHHFEFCDDLNWLEKSKNTKTTMELICEFFHFYYEFDFYHQAICTRAGKYITRMELYEQKKEQDLSAFTFDTFICIEDPFVTQHNCGRSFKSSHIYQWYSEFELMHKEITPENCIELLVRPCKYKKNIGNYIHLPTALMFKKIDFSERIPKLVPVDEVKAVDFVEQIGVINKLVIKIIEIIFNEHFGLGKKYRDLYDISVNGNIMSVSMDFEYIQFLFRESECRFLATKCSRHQVYGKKKTAEDFKEPIRILKNLAENIARGRMAKLDKAELGKNYGEVFRLTWYERTHIHEVPIFVTEPIMLLKDKQSSDKLVKFARLLHFFINETFYRMDYFHNEASNEFLAELFQSP